MSDVGGGAPRIAPHYFITKFYNSLILDYNEKVIPKDPCKGIQKGH